MKSTSPSPKLRGLFLNTARQACSIHESGLMAFQALKLSDAYALDYHEVSWRHRDVPQGYDFYVFNYHDGTSMAWLDTRCVRELPGFKATLVLEVAPNNPFVRVPPEDFDAYLVLDPTVDEITSRVHAFPRPLEEIAGLPAPAASARPVIGTFGMPTEGKGFDKLVRAANEEFDSALVRINIPLGPAGLPPKIGQTLSECRRLAKEGVELVITHDFMAKEELIRWCATNTLNCFLYDRSLPGLAATTDQAASSGRPLAVSINETFRHVHPFIRPYPLRSLRESIEVSGKEVAAMREAWAPAMFARHFEEVLRLHAVSAAPASTGSFRLRPYPSANALFLRLLDDVCAPQWAPPSVNRLYGRIYQRAVNRTRKKQKKRSSRDSLSPYANPLLMSSSQFGEDLWLDFFLRGKATGFYVDIGANHPKFNSNTRRFYSRGWSGINVEPTIRGHRLLAQQRPRDVNLQAAVSSKLGEATLYTLSDDTTLSTLDRAHAEKMAQRLKLTVSTTPIPVVPLAEIFRRHLDGRSIDFMCVDAEGHDYEVLSSNDWDRFRPAIVMIEMNVQRDAIKQLMTKHDYLLLINNQINGIFADVRNRSIDLDALLKGN